MEPAFQNVYHWVLATMHLLQPVASVDPHGDKVPWADTYEDTAWAITEAAFDEPLRGKAGPDVVFTAALLTHWAYRESRYNPAAIGDGGDAFGLWQIHPGTAHQERSALLEAESAAHVAVGLFHVSFRVCAAAGHPVEERAAQYAYGRDCEHRLDLSRSRVGAARTLAEGYGREHGDVLSVKHEGGVIP